MFSKGTGNGIGKVPIVVYCVDKTELMISKEVKGLDPAMKVWYKD